MHAIDERAARWVKGLPLRWGLGGLGLGFVWSFASSVLQGGFSNPAGGLTAAIIRVGTIIVLPLGVLGFAWGWAERFRLARHTAKGKEQVEIALQGNGFRQMCVAAICSALFWLFLRGFAPWAVKFGFIGLMVLAAPIGAVVGIVSKRNLMRRMLDSTA
jgi:hypothetical protein